MAQGYFVATCEAMFLMHHMRVYPYVRKQHNQVDALGHFILILTYTIALILRNDDEQFVNESFPKEGYGVFIVFLYCFVLPGPTIYHFCRNKAESDKDDVAVDEGLYDNPLGEGSPRIDDDDEETMEAEGGDSSSSTSVVIPTLTANTSINRLAKIQREVRETMAENQELKKQNAALLSKATDAESSLATVTAAATTAVAGAGSADAPAPEPPPPKLTAEEVKISKWKELAEDEYLSEETRAAAKLNVEQTHALELALANTAMCKSFERREVQLETALAPSAAARQAFRNWLGENRFLHHEDKIAEVCGQYVTVDDWPLLSKEDQEAICSGMTNVEAARFAAAIRAPQYSEVRAPSYLPWYHCTVASAALQVP